MIEKGWAGPQRRWGSGAHRRGPQSDALLDCFPLVALVVQDVLFGLGEGFSEIFRVGFGLGPEGRVSVLVGHLLPACGFGVDGAMIDCWRIATASAICA